MYAIAKKPPLVNIKAKDVARTHGATDFSWYLEEYLRNEESRASRSVADNVPPIILSPETRVSLYKQFKLTLPQISQVSKHVEKDTIKANPEVIKTLNGVELDSTPDAFSTVLARRQPTQRTNDALSSATVNGHPRLKGT